MNGAKGCMPTFSLINTSYRMRTFSITNETFVLIQYQWKLIYDWIDPLDRERKGGITTPEYTAENNSWRIKFEKLRFLRPNQVALMVEMWDTFQLCLSIFNIVTCHFVTKLSYCSWQSVRYELLLWKQQLRFITPFLSFGSWQSCASQLESHVGKIMQIWKLNRHNKTFLCSAEKGYS